MADRSLFRVLMVCTGNICRSPSAEAVLRAMVAEAGLSGQIEIDSAGTTSWHVGEPPSAPALKVGKSRGYDLSTLRARRFQPQDYQDFDLILAMDQGHFDILESARPDGCRADLKMFLDADTTTTRPDVPDPYYGGDRDYEFMLDQVESGCRHWIGRFKTAL